MRTAYEKGFNVITLVDGTACDSELQQMATTTGSFKLFSTPMTCAQATDTLMTASTGEESTQREDLDLDLEGEKQAPMLETDLKSFINQAIVTAHKGHKTESLVLQEAREELRSQYDTTQVFIAPAGDWTKQVYSDVSRQKQLRSVWVRGPYISPYSVASNFSSLVLIATGIGITPALGVMGQYKGNSRTKVLVWSVRSPEMLGFFCPLISTDATMAVIYYTGKDKLSDSELKRMRHTGNIVIYQKRPSSLEEVVSTIITKTTSTFRGPQQRRKSRRTSMLQRISSKRTSLLSNVENLSDMTPEERKHWAAFYCGGSKRICETLAEYTKKNHIHFESELFDW